MTIAYLKQVIECLNIPDDAEVTIMGADIEYIKYDRNLNKLLLDEKEWED